jgi:hypothetical protein
MSGYFAALAAQVVGQGVAPQAATPASLEQHIEVETQTTAAPTQASSPLSEQSASEAPDPAAARAAERHPTSSRVEPARASEVDSRIRIQGLSPTRSPTGRAPAPVSDADVAVTARDIVASPIDAVARSIGSAPIVAPQPTPRSVAPPRAPAIAPAIEATAREVERMQPIAHPSQHEAARLDAPTGVKRSEPIASIRQVDVPRPIARAAPTPPPRSEIRIGTISLEVHVPPAPVPPPAPAPSVSAPAPTPAAVATPASTRFSLHRHYVRWG